MTNASITVNGTKHEADLEPRTLLVEYLRNHLGLTGTHIGCETSQCGACTVLVDDVAVKSCTVFAVQADGAHVRTVEGLAPSGMLSPLQQAFWDNHGLQCGYCTPGVLMTTTALLASNPDPTVAQIRKALEGNLCRCTGYQNIVTSIQAAAKLIATGAEPQPIP